MLIIACFSHIRSLSSKNLHSDPMTSPSGHSRSFEVKFVLWFKLLIELRKGTEDDPNVLLSHRQIARYVTCAIGSPRGLLWPWPDVKLWPWLFMGKMHIFRHVLTRGTRWHPNYVTSFLSWKVFAKTIFVQATISIYLDLYSRDAKFRNGGPAGPKIQARSGFLRSPDLERWAYAGLEGADHNVLCIGCRASCGAWKMLAGLDAELNRFRAVPVWARAWLLENFLYLYSIV